MRSLYRGAHLYSLPEKLEGALANTGITEGSVPKDPRKAHSNNNCIRMGIRIDPCEQSIFDYFILRFSFSDLTHSTGISWKDPPLSNGQFSVNIS